MRFLLVFAILAIGCQVYNNSTSDRLSFRSVADSATDFGKAQQIFTSQCYACHGHDIATFDTEEKWKAEGFVVAGNPSASKVYYRLTGSNVGVAQEDMPRDSTLSPAQLTIIRTWITNMTP